jgi:hypothetical protein
LENGQEQTGRKLKVEGFKVIKSAKSEYFSKTIRISLLYAFNFTDLPGGRYWIRTSGLCNVNATL